MSELLEVTARLQTALDRLEAALEDSKSESNQMRAEMQSALADARRQHGDLQAITAQVATRLDSTISRLKEAVEA
jgi:hypothetical protein